MGKMLALRTEAQTKHCATNRNCKMGAEITATELKRKESGNRGLGL